MDIRSRLLYALVILVVVTAVSVAGYMALGGPSVSFLDALYMAVITIASVGYGEIVDTSHNPTLRWFNMVVVMVGVMLTVYVFSVVTAFLVEGEIRNIFWRRKMQKRIAALKDHYIVCGLGDTGRHAVEELQKTGTPYVVVEHDEEGVKRFLEHVDEAYKEMAYLVGDATDEQTLQAAGLERARGLIAGLNHDKDNLVITVMARQMNPNARIVARHTEPAFSDRLLKAGANATVSPNRIGGLRMAAELIRPHVVSFLDLMLKEKSRTLRVEDIEVPAGSAWAGQPLEKLALRAKYNLLPVAVRLADGSFLPNPPDNYHILGGMVVIVMGDVNEVRRARNDAQHFNAAAAG